MATIDKTRGADRADVGLTDVTEIAHAEALEAAQILIRDPRRIRPRYHDGRFLTAQDLTREQLYVLTRQADLATARHGGVVRGLEVRRARDRVQVSPGAGFTADGDLVTLPSPLSVDIDRIPEDDRLDVSMGVVDVAEPSPGARSGLYVLGLRPIEYATRATTRYPVSAHGAAGVENGELVEAVALTLHPLRFDGSGDPEVLRGELARAAFLDRAGTVAPDLLPLALVLLQGGLIRWLDPYLARREVAADDAGPLGLAEVVRAQREAHHQQYDRHLGELVAELGPRNALRFAASRYFRCLPAAGRLPVAAIDPATFTQAYFPPAMTVSLSVVVDDELPALIEDAMALPPIDLVGGDDDLDHVRVHVLVPLPAARLEAFRLASVAAPKLLVLSPILTRQLPIDALRGLIAKRAAAPADLVDHNRPEPAPLLAAWRQALASVPDQMLWFVRVPAVACASAELFDERDSDGDGIPDAKEDADTKTQTDAKNQSDTKNQTDAKNQSDAKNQTDTKTQTDNSKNQSDAKTQTDTKTQTDAKGASDAKTQADAKAQTDAKNTTDTKNQGDAKNDRDAAAKREADTKRDRDNLKNERDAKAERDTAKNTADAKAERDTKTEKDRKDQRETAKELRDNVKEERDSLKERRDGPAKDLRERVRPDLGGFTPMSPRPIAPTPVPAGPTPTPTPVTPVRTFIQPTERPDLDHGVVVKRRES
jgi:hypothetical protein